jgi:hypothetical protein
LDDPEKRAALAQAAAVLGVQDATPGRAALSQLWDQAFEHGRLAALDELQDRLCVCMK